MNTEKFKEAKLNFEEGIQLFNEKNYNLAEIIPF